MFDSSVAVTPFPSPVKAKKAKAYAASQALLKSIEGTSAEPTRIEEREGDSITVDVGPNKKLAKKPTALHSQDKLKGTSMATMVSAIPVAVMTTDKSHTESTSVQARGLKEEPLKKAWINTAGSDSDSEDTDPGDKEVNAGILDMVNGNAKISANIADSGLESPVMRPATKGLNFGKPTVCIHLSNYFLIC